MIGYKTEPIAGFWIVDKIVKFCQGDDDMDLARDSADFNREVGERIKRLRQRNDYTREQLAEIADISPKFLYEVETGKKGCSSYVLYRITMALDVKSDYLLIGEQDAMEKTDLEAWLNLFSNDQLTAVLEIIKTIYRAWNI